MKFVSQIGDESLLEWSFLSFSSNLEKNLNGELTKDALRTVEMFRL
jgi:hypothetical protein